MQHDVLISAEAIQARIHALARQIAADYAGEPVLCIGVMKGSFIFLADLVRAMPEVDLSVELLGVRSYQGTSSTGAVEITSDLRRSIEGAHCLIVEDIVDTGLTLRFLVDLLGVRGPASLKVVTLLDKPSRRKVTFEPDYVGFTIPDHFVVGYGLDLDERFRQWPYVAVMRGG